MGHLSDLCWLSTMANDCVQGYGKEEGSMSYNMNIDTHSTGLGLACQAVHMWENRNNSLLEITRMSLLYCQKVGQIVVHPGTVQQKTP